MCTILTTDLGLTADRVKALGNVRIVALPCVSRRFYLARFSYSEVSRVIAGVDIIHLMNHWSLLNAVVYFIARRQKKPYVMCAAGALQVFGRSQVLKRVYNVIVGRRIVRNAAYCIAITPEEVGQYVSYGVDSERVGVIRNGITHEHVSMRDDGQFRRRWGLGRYRIILFVGRLNYIKGPDLLVRAFCNLKSDLHEYQLVLVGPDEGMLSVLRTMVDESGMTDRVHCVGYLSGVAKAYAYNACELLVIPSRQEAMSIVVLEGGVTGKPVLLTDQCGFDAIREIEGGLVVAASVEGLQKGLLEMVSDRRRMAAMGANLRRHIEEHYLWQSLVSEYLKLYERLLDKLDGEGRGEGRDG